MKPQERNSADGHPLCDLHPQVDRGGPGAGVQLARRPARGRRGVHQEPAARGLGLPARPGTTTAASPAPTWTGRRCSRLLADIEAGKVDCVVVYKVDRLSRSLLDFARIMETFERHKVSFVCVTQQFNTATSMGRLMLNVLLSFAQFEREMISERTRDKIAAARRKGKWSGGMPILGYDVAEHEARGRRGRGRAASARSSSCTWSTSRCWRSCKELNARGWRTKRWTTKKGHRSRRPAVRQRLAVPAADERRLRRQGPVQGRGPRRRARGDRRCRCIRPRPDAAPAERANAAGAAVRNKHGALLRGLLALHAPATAG